MVGTSNESLPESWPLIHGLYQPRARGITPEKPGHRGRVFGAVSTMGRSEVAVKELPYDWGNFHIL